MSANKRLPKAPMSVFQARFIALAVELQQQLSESDTQATFAKLEKRHPGRKYRLVYKLPSLQLRMDASKNHQRPHIHCDVGKEKHKASIALDGELLAGKLKSAHLKVVQDWLRKNNMALSNLWHEMRAGRVVDALICKIREAEE